MTKFTLDELASRVVSCASRKRCQHREYRESHDGWRQGRRLVKNGRAHRLRLWLRAAVRATPFGTPLPLTTKKSSRHAGIRCSLEDQPAGHQLWPGVPSSHLPAEASGYSSQALAASAGSQSTAEALRLAQQRATDGTPEGTFEALRLVTDVLRAQGGEQAVFSALRTARENQQRVQMAAERPGQNWVLAVPNGTAEELKTQDAVLAASGRERVILDAAADGSSTMCPACGALVGRSRWHAHAEIWCPALHRDEDVDMEQEREEIPHHVLHPGQ